MLAINLALSLPIQYSAKPQVEGPNDVLEFLIRSSPLHCLQYQLADRRSLIRERKQPLIGIHFSFEELVQNVENGDLVGGFTYSTSQQQVTVIGQMLLPVVIQ